MSDIQVPAHDRLHGVVLKTDMAQLTVAVVEGDDQDFPGDVLYQGCYIVCYGFPYLYKPHHTILPHWAFDDFRREHKSEAALYFMIERGVRFPRADVRGRNVATGKIDDRYFKEIDIAAGLRAVAYSTIESLQPIALLDAVIWLDSAADQWRQLANAEGRASVWLHRAVPCYISPFDALPDVLEHAAREV